MMKKWCRLIRRIIVVGVMSSQLVGYGCEGTETRGQVDDGVAEMAGKNQVDRMKAMKEELKEIQSQQAKRLDQMKDAQ